MGYLSISDRIAEWFISIGATIRVLISPSGPLKWILSLRSGRLLLTLRLSLRRPFRSVCLFNHLLKGHQVAAIVICGSSRLNDLGLFFKVYAEQLLNMVRRLWTHISLGLIQTSHINRLLFVVLREID